MACRESEIRIASCGAARRRPAALASSCASSHDVILRSGSVLPTVPTSKRQRYQAVKLSGLRFGSNGVPAAAAYAEAGRHWSRRWR